MLREGLRRGGPSGHAGTAKDVVAGGFDGEAKEELAYLREVSGLDMGRNRLRGAYRTEVIFCDGFWGWGCGRRHNCGVVGAKTCVKLRLSVFRESWPGLEDGASLVVRLWVGHSQPDVRPASASCGVKPVLSDLPNREGRRTSVDHGAFTLTALLGPCVLYIFT